MSLRRAQSSITNKLNVKLDFINFIYIISCSRDKKRQRNEMIRNLHFKSFLTSKLFVWYSAEEYLAISSFHLSCGTEVDTHFLLLGFGA